MADTVPGNTSTTATIAVGSSVNGTIDTPSDHDWYKITLSAGQSISIALGGTGATPGLDTYLRFRDASGKVIAFNDDSGGGVNSLLNLTAPSAGTYYIDVGTFADASSGQFHLSVSTYVPPPVFTYDQIADQLVNGYWGGPSQSHHWNVTQDGSISVNLTGLTADGQTLARAALDLWSDVIGVTFSEVSSGGQITFDDNQNGAFCNSNWSGHITTSAAVNVGLDWLNDYGTSLNSYSFQSYIHEIGHALGLGHAGNYNSTADYAADASYRNDCWSTTIMSYFDQSDNSYFQIKGFTNEFVLSPMNADIVAMATLYGLSTTTRTDNTTYGFGSTADRDIFDATLFPGAGYTVFDNGGIDTLNFSGYGASQRIDLNSEAFSDVGGNIGNVVIARGTTIENAIGGSGADTITGNASVNELTGGGGNDVLNGGGSGDTLNGGAGSDTLNGATGNDILNGSTGNDVLSGGNGIDTATYYNASSAVTVSLALTSAQNTLGAGTDTLSGMENLIGSNFNDTLTGDGGANVLTGGSGNDTLAGNDGDDILDGGPGDDSLDGGNGIDTVDYTRAGAGVTVSLAAGAQNTVGAGVDTLIAIENLTGSKYGDTLTGNGAVNTLIGNKGDDTLIGGTGNDTLIAGDGNDILNGGNGNDVLSGGGGKDTATYASAGSAVTVNLGVTTAQVTGAGSDTLTDVENAIGSGFNDKLTGSSVVNTLDGGAGNDQIDGLGGNDILTGGAGQDSFAFTAAPNSSSNWDTISDFSVADDTILLSQSTFGAAGGTGTLSSAAFRTGTAAADADDRIIYDSATGKIYYDADGNGAGGKIQFAKVTAGTALTNLDFQVFAPAQAPLDDKSAPLHDSSTAIQLADPDMLSADTFLHAMAATFELHSHPALFA